MSWRRIALASLLVVAGFVTGQYQLIVHGVTLAGETMMVTPQSATVVVPADAKTISEAIEDIKENK